MTKSICNFGFLQSKHEILLDSHIDTDEFDLILMTATWESRGEEFLSKLKRKKGIAEKIAIVFFKSENIEVSSKKEEFFQKTTSKYGKSIHRLDMDSSIHTDKNYVKMKDFIKEKKSRLNRPLKILCDISCMPKSYIAYLLGLGFRGEFITNIKLFYAEANQYLLNDGQRLSAKNNLMTVGDWSINQIPYFESCEFMSEKHPLIVSLGAEIKACIPLIERIEPTKLHVFYIKEFASKIPKNVAKREEPFLDTLTKQYSSKNEAFTLGSIHSVYERVLELGTQPIRCLLLGPKLHALGIILAGLANDNIEINCRIPTSYSAADVTSSGICHIVEVIDRFDPDNY